MKEIENNFGKSRGNSLWEHMATTHDLYLTETELSDIYSIAAQKYDSLVAENFNLANQKLALFEALEKIILKANWKPDELISYIVAEDSPIRKIYTNCKP